MAVYGRGLSHYDIFNAIKDMERRGLKVIHFEVGDPYLPINKRIIDVLYRKTLDGYIHYGSPYGLYEFRREILNYLWRKLGIEKGIDEILVTPGSKSGLKMFIELNRREISNAILIDPSWSAYRGILNMYNIKIETIGTRFEDGWIPHDSLNKLEELDFHLLILNNPVNPTGAIYPKNILDTIMDIVAEKDAYIISDEVYFETILDRGNRHSSILGYEYEKAVVLFSLSKSHGLTGFRLGWVVAKDEIINRLARIAQYSYTNIPEFIQYAGIEALNDDGYVERVRRIYGKRVNILSKGLRRLGFKFVEPKATFYIFAKPPLEKDKINEFIYRLVYEKYVGVAPGSSFGGYNDFIRFSAGIYEEDIYEGLERIEDLLNSLD